MAHAEGPPRAGWLWVVPVSSPPVQSHEKCVHDVCAYDVPWFFHGGSRWAFEVRGGHVGAWCVLGETVYRVQLEVWR